jgi:hypothetical protein
MPAIAPSTLPGWVEEQARRTPEGPALRHKQRGAWHARSWRQTATAVERLAVGLARFGLRSGDRLAFAVDGGEQALLLALAAMRCGGAVVPLQPALGTDALVTALGRVAPRFVFAADDEAIDFLCEEGWPVIDANTRRLPAYPDSRVLDYAQLDAGDAGVCVPLPQGPEGEQDALVFLHTAHDGQAHEVRVSHRALLRDAQAVLDSLRLVPGDEAMTERFRWTEAFAQWLVGAWVLTGFRLNLGESDATYEFDRREIAPTFLVDQTDAYARIAQSVRDRLPPGRSWRCKLLARASDDAPRRALERWLTRWLIARPLAEVVGFARVRTALALAFPFAGIETKAEAAAEGCSNGLDARSITLFEALGVRLQSPPQTSGAQRVVRADIGTVEGASNATTGAAASWVAVLEREGAAAP